MEGDPWRDCEKYQLGEWDLMLAYQALSPVWRRRRQACPGSAGSACGPQTCTLHNRNGLSLESWGWLSDPLGLPNWAAKHYAGAPELPALRQSASDVPRQREKRHMCDRHSHTATPIDPRAISAANEGLANCVEALVVH